jgi:nicotinamidase-related amidase
MNKDSKSDSIEVPFRSPLLMNRDDAALVVVDVQEKLLPHIANHQRLQWNVVRLVEAAQILGVSVCATEQYPKGLGHTVEPIADRLKQASDLAIGEKTMFSCRECDWLFARLSDKGVHNLLLCGIETHVCVGQTALDLVAQGFNVFVCVDAVGSRFEIDHQTGLRRLESCGVLPTTTEAVLFEWCERAGSDEFKKISKLVQQNGP